MLDENRIKLMTRMASYESTEGKKTIPITGYFRGDYVSFHVVKAAIGATISFALIVGLYIYYHLESLIADIYKMDFMTVGKSLVTAYALMVGGYAFIAYIIYSVRYERARKSLHSYYSALRRLSSMYEDEEDE